MKYNAHCAAVLNNLGDRISLISPISVAFLDLNYVPTPHISYAAFKHNLPCSPSYTRLHWPCCTRFNTPSNNLAMQLQVSLNVRYEDICSDDVEQEEISTFIRFFNETKPAWFIPRKRLRLCLRLLPHRLLVATAGKSLIGDHDEFICFMQLDLIDATIPESRQSTEWLFHGTR
jgi:hypothetical protein